MATVTAAGNTWNTTAGNKTVTATPAAGDLIVVACANSGRTTAQPPTVTDNQGGTYTQVPTARTKASSADSMWWFVRDSVIPAATSTVFTMTQSGDSGGGLAVFRVAGMSRAGLDAVRQEGGQNNAAAGTPSVTMASAVLTGNACLGHVFNGTNGSTTTAPPSGWTESYDAGYNTPAAGREACFRNSGETNTTIAFTGASASAFCSSILELDTTVPPAEGAPYAGGGYYP